MRVALVTHRYAPHLGGIERYVEELAHGLARRDLDVHVLTPERDGALPGLSRDGMLTVHRFRDPLGLSRYALSPSLARRLRSGLGDYDLVHVFNYHELLPLLAAFGDVERLVVTPFFHPPVGGRAAHALRWPHQLLAAPAVRRADRVICLSHAEASGLAEEIPGIEQRTRVIPGGVDVDAIRAAVPFDEPKPVVLSVGRLVGYKRVDRIVKAVAVLDEDVELVVVGDGSEREALGRLAAERGVDARFTGRVSDEHLYRWLRTAAVMVTLSERESFGLTVLEAAASGARVVASDIAPHRETAEHGGRGGTAFVAVDSTPQEVAEAIRRSLRQGRCGQPRSDVVSWDDMAARVAAEYRAVAGASRSPAHR